MMPAPRTRHFRAILCAIDFSSRSAMSLRYAAALSASCGGTLTALYAEDPMLSLAAAQGDDVRRLEGDTRAELARFVLKTLGSAQAARVRCTVVVGSPGRAIVREARRLRADVVVLGTNARRGAPKLLFGSTALSVLRHVDSAVLVVPPRCRAPLPGWPAGSIVAAIEDGIYRHVELASAARMAEVFGAWLSVIPALPGARATAERRAGLVLYPQPRAGFTRRFRQGSAAYAFICASRVPVLVIRTGRRYGILTPPRRAA